VNPSPTDADARAKIARLESQVSELKDARVEDWVRLVRYGSVVPLAVETSLSWRVTRPVRLAQTAVGVLRRDGANRFWATVRARLRRRFR
jgi:hypothetical protein